MLEQESSASKQYLNKSNIHKIKPPILAIDYGTKNIGLAITDQKGIIAQPLTTINISKGNYQKLNTEIKDTIEKYNIESLVLGIPQPFKEAHLQNIDRILKFQNHIKKLTQKEVFLYDESYSTSDSYATLRAQGQSQKKSRKKIDKIAATYFLQELIDFKNKQNE